MSSFRSKLSPKGLGVVKQVDQNAPGLLDLCETRPRLHFRQTTPGKKTPKPQEYFLLGFSLGSAPQRLGREIILRLWRSYRNTGLFMANQRGGGDVVGNLFDQDVVHQQRTSQAPRKEGNKHAG
jgi:hypothetical protein